MSAQTWVRAGAVAAVLLVGSAVGVTDAHAAFGPGFVVGVVAETDTYGVAVDSAGNVFIASAGYRGSEFVPGNEVLEVPAGGGVEASLGTWFDDPEGVAVDASGDVFVADTGNNRVVELPAGGGPQQIVGSGFDHPDSVAVDAAGDVFVADTGNNRVVEIPADGGPEFVIGGGYQFDAPEGVAVDRAGDVFVADTGNDAVVEFPVGGGDDVLTDDQAVGITVDSAGDVFFSVPFAGVYELPAGGGPPENVDPDEGSTFFQLATDANGDLFIGNTEGSAGWELPWEPSPEDQTSTAVDCGDAAHAGTARTCTATVSDLTAPGTVPLGSVTFVAQGPGTFGDGTTRCTLADGSCSISYTLTSAGLGAQDMSATYSGDGTAGPSDGGGGLYAIAKRSQTTAKCAHLTKRQKTRMKKGEAITVACGALVGRGERVPVQPARPTGAVSFSISPDGDPGESVSATTCSLPTGGQDYCSIKLTTSTLGRRYTVTAVYDGDENYTESYGITQVTAAEGP